MKSIKQENFIFLDEYVENQNKALKEYFIAQNYNKYVQEAKFEESFFEGLSDNTLLYLSQQSINDRNTAIDNLLKIENSLIMIFEKQKINDSMNAENIRNNNNNLVANKLMNNGKDPFIKKWCSIHKTSSHNDNECYFKKRNDIEKSGKFKQDDLNKKHFNYIIFESFSKLKILKIKLNINNVEYSGIIDTGATNSFLSNKIVDKHELKIKGESNNVTLADGSHISSLGKIILSFGILNNKFKHKFTVLKNLENDIILGLDFLINQKVNIDLKEMKFNIGNISLNLEKDDFYAKHYSPENSLFDNEKLNFLNAKENYELKINNMIKKFESTNIKLGKIPSHKFKINLKENKIINRKPYPLPYKYYEGVKSEIKNLLKQGIIRHSTSEYSSPAFPIIKRNGDIRLVVDFRYLNKILDDSGFPFPEIWDHIYTIDKKKYFSQIDITKGFHNIEIAEEHQHLTSFVLPWGQYEYTRIPFGIKTAPRYFQSVMSSIFRDLPYVKIFIDDLLISSNSIKEHYEHLKEVISRLIKMNISVNFKKSNFFKEEVVYLGNKISKYGIQADTGRIDLIKFKIPEIGKVTLKKIKSIIGSIEWFRPFIKNLSFKLEILNMKTRKNKKLFWTEEDSIMVENILKEIQENTLLHHPNLNDNFILECDASNTSIGSVLKQNGNPIAFYSKSLSKSELNYSISEKEMLAIFKSLNHFKRLILGGEVIVYTDHRNLLYENNTSSRINKWKIILMDFNYTIKHIDGSKNGIADNLSRLNLVSLNKYSIYEIQKAQKEFINNERNHSLKYNNLNLIVDKNDKIIIPKEISYEFLLNLHEKLNHPSRIVIYNSIKKYVNIQEIMKILNEIESNCSFCQHYKNYRIFHDKTGIIKTPENPFETISSDIYGPFYLNDSENDRIPDKNYLITITDHVSRYTKVFNTLKINSEKVIECFEKWISTFDFPEIVITDNGKQYTSKAFLRFLKNKNIKHRRTSPYNPQSNGISERINQTISRIINSNKKKILMKLQIK
ncbi:Transposon Tf2-9 polyprotein [Dictyocoela muelleri]|nr:Transposon Tf2-9 polyprotein [Dictyocoela muelleri]